MVLAADRRNLVCPFAEKDEAKALGVKMGDPWFKQKDLFRRCGVVCFEVLFGTEPAEDPVAARAARARPARLLLSFPAGDHAGMNIAAQQAVQHC